MLLQMIRSFSLVKVLFKHAMPLRILVSRFKSDFQRIFLFCLIINLRHNTIWLSPLLDVVVACVRIHLNMTCIRVRPIRIVSKTALCSLGRCQIDFAIEINRQLLIGRIAGVVWVHHVHDPLRGSLIKIHRY